MSAGGGGGVVTADGTTVVVTTASGGGSGGGVISEDHNVSGGSGSKCQLSLTPRFTQEEKEILYSLFHQHEEVIDIKFRKKQRSKFSVRDAWEQIVQEFNSHPSVSATRNLKQIQKFWLNARLRKQYPFRSLNQKNNISGGGGGSQQQLVNHTIKDEPEFQLSTDEAPEHNEQQETFEEMEIDAVGVTQLEDEAIEQHQQHQQQQHVQQQPQTATLQTQQISVDQISAEKLTLNDLLKFNNTRPREEIILQIKHPSDGSGAAQITIPSPTRITLPTLPHQQHQPQQHTMATITASGYNQQIISEIKPQQITLAQFQAQQQHQQQLAAQQQQQLVVAQQQQQQQLAAVVAQQQQQHQVKMQLQPPVATQFTGTPTFTCTTFNTIPASVAPPHSTIATTAATSSMAPPPITTTSMAVDTFEEKINYFKLKEAELRFKEEQVALEKKKIELNRAQEELKHMREIHRLKVEETKMKIRVLQEEEKVLRKNHSGVHS